MSFDKKESDFIATRETHHEVHWRHFLCETCSVTNNYVRIAQCLRAPSRNTT